MRVVDHKSFYERRHKQASRKKLGKVALASGMIVALAVAVLIGFNRKTSPDESGTSISSTTSAAVNGINSNKNPNGFYTGAQFQELYESLAFPNTELLREAPAITGHEVADTRIRQIAQSRGYKLRSVPTFPIIKTNEPRVTDDDLLQPQAYTAWLQLKKAAQSATIPLELNSGYRSIKTQRELFLGRLKAVGATTEAIAAGRIDNLVVQVLSQAAPPGYSRHHTGYTIDLFCDDGTAQQFETSVCFKWLKEDNYKNAKQHAWVPSYPEGVDDQGPEPEPWEYVWVDSSIIYE